METIGLHEADEDFIREVEERSGQALSRCYQCGNCTAGCPMSFTYDYPVSRLMRFIQAGRKDLVLSARTIWMCASCETCSERCPNKIDVAGVVEACRHMACRAGKDGVYAVKTFWDAFVLSVNQHGRAHEAGLLAMYMFRTGRFWTDVDLAPKMLPKGKIAILPHRIQGRREVAEIFRRFREGAADEEAVRSRLAAERRDDVVAAYSGEGCP
ncbi:MAG: 4Fe-4S dicluster domain-containing protein [Desulfovibrio sp.]|jgi:heterodisulfide reductase subunit C|nr:4Fe-4S dicluster domain-containing protein [Desulfovibrio sp.]